MLSRDNSMTMSAISNVAFTPKREGFRPPKPHPCKHILTGKSNQPENGEYPEYISSESSKAQRHRRKQQTN